jgi:F420-dependent oxidoreductase-like protein
MSDLKFGVRLNVLPEFCEYADYKAVKRIVQQCEAAGYHSAWVMDHFFWTRGGLLECWTVLSALASATRQIRLGPLVTCNSYRHPSLHAKMGATLDVISGGRLEFGIGAGWKEDEYRAYGIPFPRASTRIAQLREGVKIIRAMWTEDAPSFNGAHYQIREAICEPKPVQQPHPPIWIGGSGEQLLLRVVAELADGCNFSGSLKAYSRKLEVLRKHCEKVGRDIREIRASLSADLVIAEDPVSLEEKVERFKPEAMSHDDYVERNIVGTPEACRARIRAYQDVGVTYFLLSLRTLKNDIGLFADQVMREFR